MTRMLEQARGGKRYGSSSPPFSLRQTSGSPLQRLSLIPLMHSLLQTLTIGCGGFLGAISRFLLSRFVGNYVAAFPLGTLLVNVVGCLLLGFLLGSVTFGKDISEAARNLAIIGFLGAFTTMSTFASETMRLLELRNYAFFGLNIVLNLFLCLFAILVGKQLALLLFTR